MNCLKEEVYPATIPYTAEVKHDGRLYRIEIPELTIPKCRACGDLTFSNSADDQVMHALRVHLRLLTPQQIKAGRVGLGLKKKQLAERLGVAPATISRWEGGLLIQSRAMDNYLRVFFAVPEARAVLRGTGQNPNLGTTEKGGHGSAEPTPAVPAVNRIQARFPRIADADEAARRMQAFQVAPGMN
jgi:DNA-binding transcriptional regulator YiaG